MQKINCLGGCSAKLDNARLKKILTTIDNKTLDSNNEDCSIYDLGNGQSLIESLDFFPQVGDNLYDYGRITACNSISDIYAMGGKPVYALNILSVTKEMTDDAIGQIIKGMADVLNDLNIPINGGHTIIGDQLLCGLAVTGFVDNKILKCNNTARVGDYIVISKPLGFGSSMSARSVDAINEEDYQNVIKWMTTPNKVAADLANQYHFSSLTDITGFGLAGHLSEMISTNDYCAEITLKDLPLLPTLRPQLDDYILSGAAANNRRNYKTILQFEFEPTFSDEEIFFDPQTSGGLMGTVSPDDWEQLLKDKNNIYHKIGVITKSIPNKVVVK